MANCQKHGPPCASFPACDCGRPTPPPAPAAQGQERKHILTDVGDCVSWCPACRTMCRECGQQPPCACKPHPSPVPPAPDVREGLDLARRFHEAYERLAPSFGYETRKDTREFDPTTPNGRLMVAVCSELLAALRAPVSPAPSEVACPDCHGQGGLPVQVSETEQDLMPCELCDTRGYIDADCVEGIRRSEVGKIEALAYANAEIERLRAVSPAPHAREALRVAVAAGWDDGVRFAAEMLRSQVHPRETAREACVDRVLAALQPAPDEKE